MSNRLCFEKRVISQKHSYRNYLLVSSLIVSLSACEAELILSGIEKTKDSPIRRTDQLMSIQKTEQGDVFVFGNDGLLLTQANAQDVWHRQQLSSDNQNPHFIDSTQCDSGEIAALSYQGNVWLSSDQGQSWVSHSVETREELQAIECTKTGDLWVVGSFASLFVSHDKAQTWQTINMNEDSMLTDVQFVTANLGYVVGEFGMMLKTEDAGKNWNSLNPIREEFYPLSLSFKNEQTGWVSGLSGMILETTDGGQSWTRQETATDAPIYGFVMSDNKTLALGDKGTILEKVENKWLRVDSPEIPTYFRSGIFTDEKNLLIAGGWGALVSLDLTKKNK